MAVPASLTETAVEFGKPQELFDVKSINIEAKPGRFQVSRDGQRFLFALPVENAPVSSLITLDTDWRAGLPGTR